MTTIIGLPSGKEIVTRDGHQAFFDKVSGKATLMFFSPDEKRVITVPPAGSEIEFYDEPITPEAFKKLNEIKDIVRKEKRYNDPSIG